MRTAYGVLGEAWPRVRCIALEQHTPGVGGVQRERFGSGLLDPVSVAPPVGDDCGVEPAALPVEGVVAGAAYRLAASPSEAYSSDSNAMKYASMYRYHLGCARIEANKGRVRGDMTVTQRPFA